MGDERRDLRFRDRGGGHDASLLGRAGHLGHDDVGLARQALRRLQGRLTSLGVNRELERLGVKHGDVVRVGSFEFEWLDETMEAEGDEGSRQ